MKERPILFSGPKVRAILSGQKTVTRRVVKGIDPERLGETMTRAQWQKVNRELPVAFGPTYFCPYGQPGDRLWVRESLHYDCEYGHYYAAGGRLGETVYLCSLFDDVKAQTGYSYDGLLPERSVPSIHLHRRYSRILLEIVSVRVERLQDISEEQALAEGIAHAGDGLFHVEDSQHLADDPRESFASLWESINGDGSWAANPWCWAVEFKRVTP
ncbi:MULTISPECIES: hypothetical protein [unclassified Pseudomonas]|uniref:hypothetical protein n=1 Tax=unclassified Pseudomonas TaxID=196821 RepID=UPI00244A2E13|nr:MULTISPECIES: hypothetical protein [unclassified Pseudomonas]MDG9927463.1 hypothetical protein [Pseudomonas sp. GD04042]MDH0482532.1 hypothetical protein [Pseudomonas sp. GD04015]MDH0602884.1 hypothetical protein [Pseudomonas sp. GD03869]